MNCPNCKKEIELDTKKIARTFHNAHWEDGFDELNPEGAEYAMDIKVAQAIKSAYDRGELIKGGEMKHTKGPWEVRASGEVGTSRGLVAIIYPVENDRLREANARLIAAAPELLEACKTANRWFEKLTQDKDFVNLDVNLCRLLNLANDIMKQAITKAEEGI